MWLGPAEKEVSKKEKKDVPWYENRGTRTPVTMLSSEIRVSLIWTDQFFFF